jgi:cytochrome c biogenesis protein CcmG/thiol:disulfide interchange protein DsbE
VVEVLNMLKFALPLVAIFGVISIGAALVDEGYPAVVTKKELYAKSDFRGKQAPEFVVEKWLNQASPNMKGKVVVIDFWATWCPPCRELIPEMNAWAKKFSKDVVFIGISDEAPDTVSGFMKKSPMNYSVAIDTKRRMYNALGVQGIPHVMVVSPDGIVWWQGFPGSTEDPLTEEKLKQVVAASKARR